MGKEARSIETVADVRKQIGEAAAQMLEKVRADYRKQQLENVALARECIALREAVGVAIAALEEPGKKYREILERLANVKHRLEAIDGFDADLVDKHIGPLESWTAVRTVSRGSVFVGKVLAAEARTFDERTALGCRPLLLRLPWRRRRHEDLSRLLELFIGLRLALGIALPTERLAATPAPAQRVIE